MESLSENGAIRTGKEMRVRSGRLSDGDRAILWKSNQTGKRVCVHTDHACLERGPRGGCEGPGCFVGVVVSWGYDSFRLGGWSFQTNIPWESAVAVWWRDEAPEPCPDCEAAE